MERVPQQTLTCTSSLAIYASIVATSDYLGLSDSTTATFIYGVAVVLALGAVTFIAQLLIEWAATRVMERDRGSTKSIPGYGSMAAAVAAAAAAAAATGSMAAPSVIPRDESILEGDSDFSSSSDTDAAKNSRQPTGTAAAAAGSATLAGLSEWTAVEPLDPALNTPIFFYRVREAACIRVHVVFSLSKRV
jgi:hypothetical protein